MMMSNINRAQQNDPMFPATEVGPDEKAQVNKGNEPPLRSHALKPKKQYHLKQLINKLNHLNFQDLHITAVFQHTKYPRSLSIAAFPMPCQDELLSCRWAERLDIEQIKGSYRF
jgi:hypothetical protein